MKDHFYEFLITLSKRMGIWLFRLVAWGIATGYFALYPARVNNSIRFYGALLPLRSRIYHFYCAWKQFHCFTHVFLDRFLYAEDY
ncbi:MAG: hypothetical protein JW902_17010, partial [Syntrophaceae bacterium]|nr:hypothetical protein [Syntrophaceae bacterium]